MKNMFYGDKSLINIVFSSFDTSNLINMAYMFYGCNSLTSLDLSHFDTSKVYSFTGIFSYCHNLTYVDISGFSSQSFIINNFNNFFLMREVLMGLFIIIQKYLIRNC